MTLAPLVSTKTSDRFYEYKVTEMDFNLYQKFSLLLCMLSSLKLHGYTCILVYLFVYQNLEVLCVGALYERGEIKEYEIFYVI